MPGSPASHPHDDLIRVEFTFDLDKIEESCTRILEECRPEFRPKLRSGQLKIKEVSGGITNKLLAAYFPDDEEGTKTLIRVYGSETEKIIDRAAEIRTILTLHKRDCAAGIYGVFENGMCYEYAVGKPLDLEMVRRPDIADSIIKELVHLHSVYRDPGQHPRFDIFYKMSEVLKHIPEKYDNPKQDEEYRELFPDPSVFEQEMEFLKNVLAKDCGESPLVFCHNDLLCGNILYDESRGRVHFIDFEYAGLNHQAFDIANHFNEYAGIDDVDYSCYPDKAYQLNWLTSYLRAWRETLGEPGEVSEHDVEQLYHSVQKFTLASHLFWIVWGFIQAKCSEIEFDFLKYSKVRYDEYLRRKKELFGV